MNISTIKEQIHVAPEYKFLQNNQKLKDNTILLTLSGSHSYGTATENSDIDLRGICIESEQDLLGLTHFEQYNDKNTDTVIFGFKKFIKLCLNNNPNIIELLGTEERHIINLTTEGKLLRDHLDLFLSKKIINSYGQYAKNQIRKIKKSLRHYNQLTDHQTLSHLDTLRMNIKRFNETYKNTVLINLESDAIKKRDIDLTKDLNLTIDVKQCSLNEFRSIYKEVVKIVQTYNQTIGTKQQNMHHRLPYKSILHTIRLLKAGTELLNGEPLQVYRYKERSLFQEIRNGTYTFDELFALIDDYLIKFEQASKYTTLKGEPDYEGVENLMINIYKNRLK